MRVTKDGKLIGTDNDGTVTKAGVGIYDITFTTGPTGSKVPLDLERCAVFATPRVDHESTPEEVGADVNVQRLGDRGSLLVDAASAARRDQDHAVSDECEFRRGRDLLTRSRRCGRATAARPHRSGFAGRDERRSLVVERPGC